jgi:toxin ParE1/3/4
MVQVTWAMPAVDDLREIYEFIERDSPRYAQNTVENITQAAERLAAFPRLGQVLPEFPHLAYRQLMVGVYRLIYREDSPRNRILIVGVIHGGRDFSAAMEGR